LLSNVGIAAYAIVGLLFLNFYTSTLKPVLIAFLFVMPGVLYTWLTLARIKWHDMLEKSEVETIGGIARLEAIQVHRKNVKYTRYEMTLNGYLFSLTYEQYHKLQDGAHYHVYRLRGIKRVMSVECISDSI
ncbi:MAG: hypothetical protein AAF653_20865, partial [Chloroflexota bacterium]